MTYTIVATVVAGGMSVAVVALCLALISALVIRKGCQHVDTNGAGCTYKAECGCTLRTVTPIDMMAAADNHIYECGVTASAAK